MVEKTSEFTKVNHQNFVRSRIVSDIFSWPEMALKAVKQERAKSLLNSDRQHALWARMEEANQRHMRRFPIHYSAELISSINLKFPQVESRRDTSTASFKEFFASEPCDNFIRAAIKHFELLTTVEDYARQRMASLDAPLPPNEGWANCCVVAAPFLVSFMRQRSSRPQISSMDPCGP